LIISGFRSAIYVPERVRIKIPAIGASMGCNRYVRKVAIFFSMKGKGERENKVSF
jgi:hypothetical protein